MEFSSPGRSPACPSCSCAWSGRAQPRPRQPRAHLTPTPARLCWPRVIVHLTCERWRVSNWPRSGSCCCSRCWAWMSWETRGFFVASGGRWQRRKRDPSCPWAKVAQVKAAVNFWWFFLDFPVRSRLARVTNKHVHGVLWSTRIKECGNKSGQLKMVLHPPPPRPFEGVWAATPQRLHWPMGLRLLRASADLTHLHRDSKWSLKAGFQFYRARCVSSLVSHQLALQNLHLKCCINADVCKIIQKWYFFDWVGYENADSCWSQGNEDLKSQLLRTLTARMIPTWLVSSFMLQSCKLTFKDVQGPDERQTVESGLAWSSSGIMVWLKIGEIGLRNPRDENSPLTQKYLAGLILEELVFMSFL